MFLPPFVHGSHMFQMDFNVFFRRSQKYFSQSDFDDLDHFLDSRHVLCDSLPLL